MAEADPFDDHPVRSKRNRKFPKVDRDKPVSRGIADPGPGPHEITVLPLDANGVAIEERAVVLDGAPAEPPDSLAEALIEAMAEPVVGDEPIPAGIAIEPSANPQPEVEVEPSIDTDVSGMSMPEVLLWAGDDPARRAHVLAAERERAKPRKGVLTALGE